MDLRELLGRENESFTVSSKLAKNGYSITVSSLVDSGANGYIFIDGHTATLIAKFFNTKPIPLPNPCAVRGYNGKSTTPITHALIMNLILENRSFRNLPMLIVKSLGRHDVILGKKWLGENRILVDCHRTRLLWPDEPSPYEAVATALSRPIPWKILKRETSADPAHQADADRRDKLIEHDEQNDGHCKVRFQDPPVQDREMRYRPPRTYNQDYQDALVQMDRELRKPPKPVERPRKPTIACAPMDIAVIGAPAFSRHAKKKMNEIFTTSLYELDRLLDDRIIDDYHRNCKEEDALILRTLPPEYHEFADVFSKKESDQLPP